MKKNSISTAVRMCGVFLVAVYFFSLLVFALTPPNVITSEYVFTQKLSGVSAVLPALHIPDPSLTSVRHQGQDAVSWAFSGILAIEAAIPGTYNFSQNHMRYALSDQNPYGFDRSYTAYGNRNMVAAYVMREKMGGPILSSRDPYSPGGSNPPRDVNSTLSRLDEPRVRGIVYIPDAPPGDELMIYRIKNSILLYNAVSASLAYNESNFLGNIYINTDEKAAADHSVAVIGWDDSISAFYVNDSYAGKCYWVSYDTPLKEAYAINGSINLEKTYEYDYWGQNSSLGYNSHTAYFANIFTVTSQAEALTEVSYFAMGENASVEIYVLPEIEGAEDLKISGTPVYTGTTELPGYYTAVLSEKIYLNKNGGKFAVIIKASTPNELTPIPLQTAHSGNTTAGTGQSYVSSDAKQWVDSYLGNLANVCIKAHVRTGMSIPLADLKLTAEKNGLKETGLTNVLIGDNILLSPAYTPSNANNISSVQWEINEGDGFLPAAGSEGNIVSLDTSTGRITATGLGQAIIRVSVTTGNGILTDEISVKTSYTPVDSLTLDKTEAVINSSQQLQLSATVVPADIDLSWYVADSDGTPYELEYNPYDPYRPGSPIAIVSSTGTVTPIQAGTCTIVVHGPGGQAKAVCTVTITEIPLTGIKLNKSSQTLCIGTSFTPIASVQPESATYRNITWSTEHPDIVYVDPKYGVIRAKAKGTAIVTATNQAGQLAECTVTVTDAPSTVLRIGRSNVFAMNGLPEGVTADIELLPTGRTIPTRYPHSPSYVPFYTEPPVVDEAAFTVSQKGNTVKVTAEGEAGIIVRMYWDVNTGTEQEPNIVTIAEQSWLVEGVVPISRVFISDTAGNQIRKITLSADNSNPLRNESVYVLAELSGDSTELGFEWSSQRPEVASIVLENDPLDPLNKKVKIVAHSVGTTRITLLSHNGNKKTNLDVKVKNAPSGIEITSSVPELIAIGKNISIKAHAVGSDNINKALKYFIIDSGDNDIPHTTQNPIASISSNGKVKALREGSIFIIISAAPYNSGAAYQTLFIRCHVPIKSITLTTEKSELELGERTLLSVSFSPENADLSDITYTSSNPEAVTIEQTDSGLWATALKPGRTRITAASEKRKSSIVIKSVK